MHCIHAVDPVTFESGNITMILGPNNVDPSLELSCKVTNEGSFDFTWTPPSAATNYHVLADAPQTSRLLVLRLTASHTGDYVCQANYDVPPDVRPPPTLSGQRIISVEFIGMFVYEPHVCSIKKCDYVYCTRVPHQRLYLAV